METTLFTALSLAAILSALMVVTAPSPIASALYLVLTLFSLAGFYVLLAAPFVAAIQVIVYAGAVVVLILFVIMLLNLKPIQESMTPFWRVAGIVIAALVLLTTFLSVMGVSGQVPTRDGLPGGFGAVKEIGKLVFTNYLYAFEVVSVLLLLAVVGAVALTRKPDDDEAPRAN